MEITLPFSESKDTADNECYVKVNSSCCQYKQNHCKQSQNSLFRILDKGKKIEQVVSG